MALPPSPLFTSMGVASTFWGWIRVAIKVLTGIVHKVHCVRWYETVMELACEDYTEENPLLIGIKFTVMIFIYYKLHYMINNTEKCYCAYVHSKIPH